MDIRLPVARDMKIADFSGGTITAYSSYMQNAMIDKIASDTGERMIVTQRPAIDMVEDASATVSKLNGRGIYHWPTNSADYFINDDTIYKGGYVNTVGTITSGVDRCYFFEVGARLVVVDPENNEVWTITSGDVLAEVVDADLPSTISGGGAVLDGYLFLLDDTGVIHQSDLDDATSWDALNIIEAEREPDSGTFLGRHRDHLVAFGKSTIEFFYNAANATGSVLSRRQDIFYNIGCPHEQGVWEDGDVVYFLGRSQRGDYGIYEIDNFQARGISTTEFNSYLTSVYADSTFLPLLAGFAGRGHSFVAITIHTTNGDIEPVYTFVYDRSTSLWGPWTTALTELSALAGFPVMAWTSSSSSRYGSGLMTNGDLITIKGTFTPIDTFSLKNYIEDEDDYVAADYIELFGVAGGANVDLVCRMGHLDSNSNKNKFAHNLEVIGDYTPNSQTLTLKWSDTDHTTFTSTRTLDTSKREKLSRLGIYNRRTYQLEYSGSDILRLEAIECSLTAGVV